jgi:hypothetical protein
MKLRKEVKDRGINQGVEAERTQGKAGDWRSERKGEGKEGKRVKKKSNS